MTNGFSKTRRLSCCQAKSNFDSRWSTMDSDLLTLALIKLPVVDVLRTRSVCSSWRSTAKTYLAQLPSSLHQQPQSPIMIEEGRELLRDGRCYFYSLADKKFRLMRKEKELAAGRIRCFGSSSDGWLIFLDTVIGESPYLYNPYINLGIRLPPSISALTLGTNGVKKAVLWGDPIRAQNANNYGIIVLYGELGSGESESRIAYVKCGNQNWVELNGSDDDYCCDITNSSSGNYTVYTVSGRGCVDTWDFSGLIPQKAGTIEPRLFADFRKTKLGQDFVYSAGSARMRVTELVYLVESKGEFMLICRRTMFDEEDRIWSRNFSTQGFCIYKLHSTGGVWRVMTSLGEDRILFLGRNNHMLVSASDFPKYQKNSIYFSGKHMFQVEENYPWGGFDSGVFNFREKIKKGMREEGEGPGYKRFGVFLVPAQGFIQDDAYTRILVH